MKFPFIFWLVIALLGLFTIVFAWKKDKFKGLLYLGIIFTTVGLIEKFRYGEWSLLLMGLLFLFAAWLNRKKWKKPRN